MKVLSTIQSDILKAISEEEIDRDALELAARRLGVAIEDRELWRD